MASEGVWRQGSLLGSWGRDRVRGLLWPFCSLCLQEEAKARRRVKSRGPSAPEVGVSACVDERSSFPGYWETKANSARKGREGRRGERAGRHWASRAVFLLRTCYKLENQGQCVDSPPHRARQTHVGASAQPPCPEGSHTPQLHPWREGSRVFKCSQGKPTTWKANR